MFNVYVYFLSLLKIGMIYLHKTQVMKIQFGPENQETNHLQFGHQRRTVCSRFHWVGAPSHSQSPLCLADGTGGLSLFAPFHTRLTSRSAPTPAEHRGSEELRGSLVPTPRLTISQYTLHSGYPRYPPHLHARR